MATGRRTISQEHERLSADLAEIIDALSGKDLEIAAIVAIRKHREMIETAELAHEAWSNADDGDPCKADLEHCYIQATMNNTAQIAVVDALITKLGYIPQIP